MLLYEKYNCTAWLQYVSLEETFYTSLLDKFQGRHSGGKTMLRVEI